MKLRLLVYLSLCLTPLAAQTRPAKPLLQGSDRDIKLGEDEPGCKDSPVLPRLPGCSIIQCDTKDADGLEIQVGAATDGSAQKEPMDGPAEVIYYLCPAKTTLTNIVKQNEAALAKGGYKVVFSGKDDDENPLVTALKDTQWVQISTYTYENYGAYVLTTVKVTPESQASSEALADEMNKHGRVSLPPAMFTGDDASLAADAARVLSEVAAYLVRQPEVKVRVEVRLKSDQPLARQRAVAVASWLLEHGIDQSRISILPPLDEKNAGDSGGEQIELVRI